MKEFRDYDILYPELVYDVLNYFRLGNEFMPTQDKTIMDFCNTSRYSKPGDVIQPDTIHVICEQLVRKGSLSNITSKIGPPDHFSNYLFCCSNDEVFLQKHPILIHKLNCMVYGFRYIYNRYRNLVLPVVTKTSGDVHLGTCFKFHNGILTAKHCLTVDKVAIPGYTSEQLSRCKVLISNDPKVDMAYIDTGDPSLLIHDEPHVLDEVLVMGYPRIPQFLEFCTAERAEVSSIPTKGSVASLADQYLTPSAGKLILVTARIRAGNSGGPIINADGSVIGVAFMEPMYEGNYDEMGYGGAYPMNVFYDLLKDSTTLKVNFVDEIKS